jgi:uncharacterized protein YxeA
MKHIITVVLFFASTALFAFDNDSIMTRLRPYITQDQKIDQLLEMHKAAMEAEKGIPGFRVQIFTDSGNQARLMMQRTRAEFEKKYPGVKAYPDYVEPNFTLRVGDFRTRLDARRFLETIVEDYPPGQAYIVVDTINFPE